jgi:hypothetical protein
MRPHPSQGLQSPDTPGRFLQGHPDQIGHDRQGEHPREITHRVEGTWLDDRGDQFVRASADVVAETL